jgi:hypothetical protein
MQQYDSNLRRSVREHFTDNTPTSRLAAFFARLDWRMVYDLGTLATIALCGIAHAVNAFQALNSPSLFASVMPVFGFTACIAYGLVCYASKKGGVLKLVFVAGALTTFWVQ